MWQRCVGRATRWIRSRNSCCSPIPCWRVSEDAQAASQFRSWVVWSSRLEGGCVLRGCQSCSNSRDLQSAAEKSSFLYSAFRKREDCAGYLQPDCKCTANRCMRAFNDGLWYFGLISKCTIHQNKNANAKLLAVSHTTYKTFLLASLANL